MLIDEIRARVTQAVKDKDEVARDVLRLAMSESQMVEVRSGKTITDDDVAAVLRKLVKSNEETLAAAPDGAQAPSLRREIEVLTSLLPKGMSVDDLVGALAPVAEAIRGAKNDGAATGLAMKHMKSVGGTFTGQDVGAAVKKLRG
jgi:hypothetical protein